MERRSRTSKRILVVDDEESLRYTFRRFLADEGHTVAVADSYPEAIKQISRDDFDLIFADIILGAETGIDLLRELRNRHVLCPVVIVTGFPNLETATEAVRLGAFDYVAKPVTQETLLHMTRLALKHWDVVEEKERYRTNLDIIFRNVKDAIITVDDELRVVEVNPAAQELCGMSRDAVVGQRFPALTTGCRGRCRHVLEQVVATRRYQEVHRTECCSPGNTRHVVTISATPIVDTARRGGAVLVIRDETRLSELERDLESRRQFFRIVGESAPMQKIFALIENLADVDTTVLVTGESGTGKELVAEALHYHGSRRDNPLVKVSCSALTESLLESELFGHVRGAFTGAVGDRVGRFERAHTGTVFLDEIGDISPKIQVQLLRVIQEKEFERVGSAKPVKIDVRVIAATNRDLRDQVTKGLFREDLLYRLKVVEIPLPPLRERRDDVPLLTSHFLKEFNAKFGKHVSGVSEEVADALLRHPWPGNVRELMHVLEHGCIMCNESVLRMAHLPPDFSPEPAEPTPSEEGRDAAVDRDTLLRVLAKTDGNKAKTARLLGMSRQTLYRKIQEYDIKGE